MDEARGRRVGFVLAVLLIVAIAAIGIGVKSLYDARTVEKVSKPEVLPAQTSQASDALEGLLIKGRAPKTGYEREQFTSGWAEIDGCDMRNIILQRDLTNEKVATDGCVVVSGTLDDPYTGNTFDFKRGSATSSAVQIDHVVALSNAWQTGAQSWDEFKRAQFANDPLNLLAVDGPTNQKKGDADAATWLPPNKDYRCRYVARQIAVKRGYDLWVTQAEYDAMARVLSRCPAQILPIVTDENTE